MSRAGRERRALLALVLAALACATACRDAARILPPELRHAIKLPVLEKSVRFAVIGDTGTGARPQYQVGERMAEAHEAFAFDFVIMLGDNLYGLERPQDYVSKFERPYAALLKQDIKFYAALGNHDNPNQRFYEPFNMGGERYYAFSKGDVRFFALDSNYMDERQLQWLSEELAATSETWKIVFFHHPLYSSGGFHGSEYDLRDRLEPLFVEHGVRVVFSGHEHFYERIKPQKGVYYFIAGGSARLRRGNIRPTDLTAKGFDTDNSFMLVEISGDQLYFETVSRTGELIEAGEIARADTVATPEPGAVKPPEKPVKPGPKDAPKEKPRQTPQDAAKAGAAAAR